MPKFLYSTYETPGYLNLYGNFGKFTHHNQLWGKNKSDWLWGTG